MTLRDHRWWFTELAELGYTDVWSAEVDGADGFTPLALAAAWEPALNLGVAIAPAYTRGPALLAQTAAAMAEAAPGRFALGLGASSEVIVQRWNAVDYVDPFHRVRDTLRFLRAAFGGEKVTADFGTFAVEGFRLSRPVHPPPVYLAALRAGMLRLAGREADGVVLNWLSADDVATSLAEVGPDKEVVARIFVVPTDDASLARQVGRRMVTAYLNVPAYAEFHRWLGRGPLLQPMWDAWAAGDRRAALDAVPDGSSTIWSSTAPREPAVTTSPGTWTPASPCRPWPWSRSATWARRCRRSHRVEGRRTARAGRRSGVRGTNRPWTSAGRRSPRSPDRCGRRRCRPARSPATR